MKTRFIMLFFMLGTLSEITPCRCQDNIPLNLSLAESKDERASPIGAQTYVFRCIIF